MKLTTLAVSSLLALAPGLALAGPMGCGHDKSSASVCDTGYMWDEEKQACVEVVSS